MRTYAIALLLTVMGWAESAVGQVFFVSTQGTGNEGIVSVSTSGVVTPFVTRLGGPQRMAFDSSGNLFVNDIGQIDKITPDGTVSTFTATINSVGTVFDSSGNLYVSQPTGANPADILMITPGGTVSTFATGFSFVSALAIDSSGNIYASDEDANTIDKISPLGVVSTFATGIVVPQGLAFDYAGNLFVTNSSDNIFEVSPTGVISTFVANFVQFGGLTFDNNDNLYVVAPANQVVYIFAPDGSFSGALAAVTGAYDIVFTTTPEPSSVLLLVGGLGLIPCVAGRRTRPSFRL